MTDKELCNAIKSHGTHEGSRYIGCKCDQCEGYRVRLRKNRARRSLYTLYKDMGLVKARGMLVGTYWE